MDSYDEPEHEGGDEELEEAPGEADVPAGGDGDNGDGVALPPPVEEPPIAEGDYVVLEQQNDRCALVAVTQAGSARLGSATVSLAPLLGCPFGSRFEVRPGGRLARAPPPAPALGPLSADGRSNRTLVDDGRAQALGAAEIAALKAGGGDVVAALCAASSTFASKTAFSQAKYAAKKARKHCASCVAARPGAGRVHAALFASAPARVAFLRPDALSLALAFAHVRAGADVLAVDGCGGVVLAALAERLGPPILNDGCDFGGGGERSEAPRVSRGSVVALQLGREAPGADALRYSPEWRGCGGAAASAAAPALWRATLGDVEAAFDAAAAGGGGAEGGAGGGAAPPAAAPAAAAAAPAPAARRGRLPAAPPALLRRLFPPAPPGGGGGGFSCLVAAPGAASDPAPLLRRLLPLLAPGAPFALVGPCLQPLAEAAEALVRERLAVDVGLHEPWLRAYQCLPGRSHPAMRMSATGGFVLRGHRVAAAAGAGAGAATQQQQQRQQRQPASGVAWATRGPAAAAAAAAPAPDAAVAAAAGAG